MNKREREVVREHLEGVFQSWHFCALGKSDAKAMGLKEGRLCDNCRDAVIATMKSIAHRCERS